MKRRELEKLLQNSLPKESPDFWDEIEQSYFMKGELPRVRKYIPWYRYAAAAACVCFAVLIGAQMFQKSIKTCANYSPNSTESSEMSQSNDEIYIESAETQIINDVNNLWKEKYPDINITNEWQGVKMKLNNRTVVLFGSLKSDPRQGVAEVVNTEGDVVSNETRYLSSERHGALRVSKLGSNGTDMYLIDDDGLEWHFEANSGFAKDKLKNKPQIINNLDKFWKEKYPDITITNEWLSAQDDYRNVVLFGALKSNPRIGVAEVINMNGDGSVIYDDGTYLSPEEHGALKVIEPGSDNSGSGIIDEDGFKWTFLGGGFISSDRIISLPQINKPSNAGDADSLPQIINDVENTWKEKLTDINITNGWLGIERDTIVFFGSLKSDPRQGAVNVIHMYNSREVSIRRFLSPQKHGTLRVSELGAKQTTMGLVDEDGLKWNFHEYIGFQSSSPVNY